MKTKHSFISNSNFEKINFHDCKVYAIGFDEVNKELLIDTDLITSWIFVDPLYQFEVSPSIIVFKNVWDINFDISMDMELIINDISFTNPQIPKNKDFLEPNTYEYNWEIDFLQGEISFKSIGIEIYQREKKQIISQQNFSIQERGGISLEKKGVKLTF